MRIETLKDRIENAKTKIEKKGNTIIKKEAWIEKKTAKLAKMGFTPETADRSDYDAFWLGIEIRNLKEDIERNLSEIEEIKANLEKYEKQLAGELEKESILLKEIPESMKRMQSELVEKWDAWDIERRNQILEDYRQMNYTEFSKKYRWSEREWMYSTDEQIHKANMQDAKELIINLYHRIRHITGEVTDWSGIYATVGTWGGTVLNGKVIGKEGIAQVESIYAGGYNIQRLHVRVLVHEWK